MRLLTLCLVIYALSANAQPCQPSQPGEWIVYGQTPIPANSLVNNPLPNTAGTLGEVCALPYTVPAGLRLRVLAYGIEGNRDPISTIVPWLGVLPFDLTKALYSVGSQSGSQDSTGARFTLPSGAIVNVILINGSPHTMVHAWYMRGLLETTR